MADFPDHTILVAKGVDHTAGLIGRPVALAFLPDGIYIIRPRVHLALWVVSLLTLLLGGTALAGKLGGPSLGLALGVVLLYVTLVGAAILSRWKPKNLAVPSAVKAQAEKRGEVIPWEAVTRAEVRHVRHKGLLARQLSYSVLHFWKPQRCVLEVWGVVEELGQVLRTRLVNKMTSG